MNLASIVQAIASAVNAKMSMQISQQIAQISVGATRGPGWISQTAAGRSISQSRLNSSFAAAQNATNSHQVARTSAQKATEDWLKESLAPTGRDLAELGATAAKYKTALDLATAELDRVTKEHHAIKAAEVSEAHLRRSEKMDDAISKAEAAHGLTQQRYSSLRDRLTQEATNPSGMSPGDLNQLEIAVAAYESELKSSVDSLASLRSEQDALRRAIDTRLLSVAGIDQGDLTRLDHAGKRAERSLDVRNAIQSKHDDVRSQYLNEVLFPTGKSEKQMSAMADSIVKYKAQLDAATIAASNAVNEQEQLRQAIERQIHSMTGIDSHALDSANRDVAEKAAAAMAAKHAVQSTQSAIDVETINPTGMTPAQIQQLKDDLEKYEQQVVLATSALHKSTSAQTKIQKSLNSQAIIQQAAIARHGHPFSLANIQKRLSAMVRKSIGANGRKQISKAIVHAKNIRDPQAAKRAALAARKAANTLNQTHASAKATHLANTAAHKAAPTAATEAAMASSGRAAAMAGGAAEAAEGVAALSEVIAGLAAAAGPVGIAIGAVVVAITYAANRIGAVVQEINQQLADSAKEVERYRNQRMRFSSVVTGAVARYDMQSIQLEARSSAKTGASAKGVVESAMRLRESNQDRSERWENIANQQMEIKNVIATFKSDVLSAIDIYTPLQETSVYLQRESLKLLGFKLAEISTNTKANQADNVGLETIRLFNHLNVQARGNKDLPVPPPLKPVK